MAKAKVNRKLCNNCGRVRSSIVPLTQSWAYGHMLKKRVCWECFNATVQEQKQRREEGKRLAAAEARRQKTKKWHTLNRQICEGKPHGPIPDVDDQLVMFDESKPEVDAAAPREDASNQTPKGVSQLTQFA